MSWLIDADALEREGWSLSRNRQVDEKTMVYEVKKPTNFPPVEPERKKGKWIEEDQYIDEWGDTIKVLRCPICEFKHDYTQGSISHNDDGWFNFCPNCGADNRG